MFNIILVLIINVVICRFNPDRRHVMALGRGLKLGEGFFVGSHSEIYKFLSLPSYPPYVSPMKFSLSPKLTRHTIQRA